MAPRSARASSLYAEMDLTGVVSTLESHWVVLDAELSEIRKDFATLKALTRKHGDFWSRPMAQLKKLRTQKENLLKEYAPHTRASNSPRPLPGSNRGPRPPLTPLQIQTLLFIAGSNSRWSSSTCTSSRAATCARN